MNNGAGHHPHDRSAQQGNRNCRPTQRGIQRKQQGENGGHSQNRAQCQIDASRQDDKGHTCREDNVNRGLSDNVNEIVSCEKAIGEESEENTDDQQYRKHTCDLYKASHQLFSCHVLDGVLSRSSHDEKFSA